LAFSDIEIFRGGAHMVIPYLSFCGDCEEALKRYSAIFGGEILGLSRFTPETGSPALVGKVMHAEVKVGNSIIAGSDGGDPKELTQYRDTVSLMVHCVTRAEAEKRLGMLAEGGQVLQRLSPHPPPDDGGMGALVRDKYGYKWIMTAPNDYNE
jgi:PhnB protein